MVPAPLSASTTVSHEARPEVMSLTVYWPSSLAFGACRMFRHAGRLWVGDRRFAHAESVHVGKQVSTCVESSRQSRLQELPGGPAVKFHHRVVDARSHFCTCAESRAARRACKGAQCTKPLGMVDARRGREASAACQAARSASCQEWFCRPAHKQVLKVLRRWRLRLCVHITRFRRWLRRGKGVLWVAEPCSGTSFAALRCIGSLSEPMRLKNTSQKTHTKEDPRAKWEWELSGQLRFSCRRTPSGFGGAEAFSSLALRLCSLEALCNA